MKKYTIEIPDQLVDFMYDEWKKSGIDKPTDEMMMVSLSVIVYQAAEEMKEKDEEVTKFVNDMKRKLEEIQKLSKS